MPALHLTVWMFLCAMMNLGAGALFAQDYPGKPVRIITTGVGGGNDFAARLIAQGISGPLGQQVIVDNRGNGVLAGELVAKAPPDGYTLFVGAGDFWFGPLMQDTPYDPLRDFLPITIASQQVNVVVVHPSLPVKSIKELIALAKSRPGALNYGSGATGSSSHLSVELFKSMAGIDVVHVPFKSGSSRIAALIGGEVQLMFSVPAPVAPLVKSGRLRALAVTSAEPSELFPGLPTVAATGLRGYEYVGMTGVFAPAKTPETIVNRLNQEIVRALKRPETKQAFLKSGVETVGSSPQVLAGKIRVEIARMGKIIKDAGIRE